MAPLPDGPSAAHALLDFINSSPTPYHAVREAVRLLEACGFVEADEREPWRFEPGAQVFVVRGGGTLVAFRVGTHPPAEAGFLILGAHTDSPNLRLKPAPDVQAHGYWQWGVEVYGGVLLHTWLDRDLALAGRVTLRGGPTHLVRLDRPLCRIPSLAIHLDRSVNQDGLKLNPQVHLRPMLALESEPGKARFERLVSEWLLDQGVSEAAAFDILGHELSLYELAPGTLAGAHEEFLVAPRLDNLASCYVALQALLEATIREATQMVVLHDHEEVGSETAHGAASHFLLSLLERLASSAAKEPAPEAMGRARARSLVVSVDMAHAVHPSHPERHDEHHRPLLGGGPVLKTNASQRYATDSPAQAVFQESCRAVNVEPQVFVSRNDALCGSTIGPISAARLGIRTVDVGCPMLSMHSCREVGGTRDAAVLRQVLTHLLSHAIPPPPSV